MMLAEGRKKEGHIVEVEGWETFTEGTVNII